MKVTLIGAGPGSKGLLTLRGLEVLQTAQVVLYDRFVGEEKHAGNHPVPQN